MSTIALAVAHVPSNQFVVRALGQLLAEQLAKTLECGSRQNADFTQVAFVANQSGCAAATIGNRALAFVSAAPALRTYLRASSSRTRFT